MEIDRIRMQVLDSEKFDEHFLSFPPIRNYSHIFLHQYYFIYVILDFINVNCDF